MINITYDNLLVSYVIYDGLISPSYNTYNLRQSKLGVGDELKGSHGGVAIANPASWAQNMRMMSTKSSFV
jgi:hypothetical protein